MALIRWGELPSSNKVGEVCAREDQAHTMNLETRSVSVFIVWFCVLDSS